MNDIDYYKEVRKIIGSAKQNPLPGGPIVSHRMEHETTKRLSKANLTADSRRRPPEGWIPGHEKKSK